jgi:hypothetical protein
MMVLSSGKGGNKSRSPFPSICENQKISSKFSYNDFFSLKQIEPTDSFSLEPDSHLINYKI